MNATSMTGKTPEADSMKEKTSRRTIQPRRRKKKRKIPPIAMLLTILVVVSLAFNFHLGRTIKISVNDHLHSILTTSNLRNGWIPLDAQPFNKGQAASKTNHLIVVAGHSTIISGHLEDAGEDETDWYLLDYQKGQGLPQAIKAHIQAGIEEAARDPESLLVFSGGETRALTGPASEGPSYFHAADACVPAYALVTNQNILLSHISLFPQSVEWRCGHITATSGQERQRKSLRQTASRICKLADTAFCSRVWK